MITVIICFYDEIDFIHLSLQSLQKQNIDDLEIILVDDFSNYEAQLKSICNSFRSLNIIYLRNEKNIGLARSRNKGLENAKEIIFLFLTLMTNISQINK